MSGPSTVLPPLAVFIQDLQDIQTTRYCRLASSCIIIFEHLLTLDDEINTIWKAKWSLPKTLFLLNRYYSLGVVVFHSYAFFSPALTDSFCLRFFIWEGITGVICPLLAEGILQLRIYALYSMDKRILGLMLGFFVVCSGISAWNMGTVLSTITASATPIPGGKFCVPSGDFGHFYIFWIPLLAFESVLCALALNHRFRGFHLSGNFYTKGQQLIDVLIRDSVLYFFVIFITYFICLLIWVFGPVGLLQAPIGFVVAMSCVLGSRLILNLRKADYDYYESTSW